MAIGFPLRHLRECDSTNRVARELAAGGAPHGTAVTTGLQTAGRGRQGREWVTMPPDSSLSYSAIFRSGAKRDDEEHPLPPLLPLVVAVAVCDAIETVAPVETLAKWPNDVWIQGRKCAGILIEARPQNGWAVIGIGLNLSAQPEHFPPEIRDRATSVGHGVALADARTALSASLSDWLARPDTEVVEEFSARDALRGKKVKWDGGAGEARGVDKAGNLLVSTESGQVRSLAAGEVHLAPLPGAKTR